MSFNLIRNEIPTFMHRTIFSATFFAFDSDNLNVLVLLRDKKLYLVRNREILSEISLENTIFKKVDLQDCPTPYELTDVTDEDSCVAVEVEDENTDFRLEKFVLNDDLHGTVTLVLIKIHDNLVVLQLLQESKCLQIVKQLEDVDDFVVLENPKYSYKPRVQILFKDGNSIETNFSKIEESVSTSESGDLGNFKAILKSLELGNRKLRIDLQQLQEETKRRFVWRFFM